MACSSGLDVSFVDPHLASGASRDAATATAVAALKLRPARWDEVGPDAFFLVVNGAVALFAWLIFASGLVPPIASCAHLGLWVALVFARNWGIMLAVYGGYHWLFFSGGYAWLTGAQPTKFNPAAYEKGQLTREVTYTTISMGIASAYECLALVGWARGWFPRTYFGLGDAPLVQVLLTFLGLALFADGHFWIVHRALHIPAIYKLWHRLHHQSRNPGPWSGMSMHPVESTLYISRVLLPLFVAAHPLHFYFSLYNTTLMPVPGHSGHEELLGNTFHWVHHHAFQHNYGSPAVPLDKLFGSDWRVSSAPAASPAAAEAKGTKAKDT